MASREEKKKIENKETKKVVASNKEGKEVSQEEFLNIANAEKSKFEEETKNALQNLNSVDLDEHTFNEIKNENKIEEALGENLKEANAVIENAKKSLEGAEFNRDKCLYDLKAKIENANSLEEIVSAVTIVLESQKDREDLKMLFNNFKFKASELTSDGKESLVKDYFGDIVKTITESLSDPRNVEQVKNTDLVDIKKQSIEALSDIVPPTLQGQESPEYLKMLEKIQSKIVVPEYNLSEFVDFLNQYNEVSKGREGTFDKFIFKDFPKKKDDFFHVKNEINYLLQDPLALEKIDFIDKSSLNKTLNLFDGDEFYRTEYGGPEKAEFLEDSNILKMPDYKKGVNIFNTEYVQTERANKLHGLSLGSLKLAKNNEYFDIKTKYSSGAPTINLITEEELKKIHDFDSNLKELDLYQMEYFKENVENLPQDIKDFYQKVYNEQNYSGNFSAVANKSFFELAKSPENLNKIKKCFESRLISTIYDNNYIERVAELDEKIIDLMIETGEGLNANIELLEKVAGLNDPDKEKYKEIVAGYSLLSNYDKLETTEYVQRIKEIPAEEMDFFLKWQNTQGNKCYFGIKKLTGPLDDALYRKEDFSKLVEFHNSSPDADSLIFDFFAKNDPYVSDIVRNIETYGKNPKKFFTDNPKDVIKNFDEIQKLLASRGESLNQEELNSIFNYTLKSSPQMFLEKISFPLSPEQQKVIDIFTKISNSPSSEMKNMALELSLQIVEGGDLSTIDERYEKIDSIFVRNNIPFVGKQAKICEALHPQIVTQNNSSPELQSLHSNNARRLLIFKDLMLTNFNSLNSNLEQYLLVFKSGQEVLDKYESGEQLSGDEEEKLKYFFKKINALSENTKKTDKFNKFDLEDLSLTENLQALKSNFGVGENQTIIGKFEDTFLKRIGISNFSEALKRYDDLREAVSNRNKQLAESGQINLGENDLAKGISIDYFDKNLDRGIYAPEFIGAETIEAKGKSKGSDSTPWDTDLIMVGNRNTSEIIEKSTASGYGEAIIIIRDRGQFNRTEKGQPIEKGQDKLELFKTRALGEDHYGIRTGFGSTEIDALLAKDNVIQNSKQLDSLKFSIAQKGFYIPICDKTGKVIFTADEYEEYKKIFAGVDKYHGEEISLREDWKNSKFSEDISKFSQTNENLDNINKIKDDIYSDIESDLKTFGIELHKGRYDDSVVGAKIIDTGSTGRGAALDEGYDLDFVIKVDDRDADKISQMAENLKKKYPYDQDYERDGMRTYRFKSFEKDGNKIDLDISFVKKSDSEELDANEAVAQKYDSIKKSSGEDKLLDVLTNVRFAKKELKEAGCYKKGMTGNGEQQGGMGGIGVENWILQNGGDAVDAFRDFNKNAYQDGELVSFNDFKKKYKIFSAGSNIRGGVKAENFVYNMDETGYNKMAELSKKFI